MADEIKKDAVEVAEPNQPKVEPVVENDVESLLAEKEAKILKLSEERDNYRKGLLKAKGKLPEDEQENENVDFQRLAEEAARKVYLESEIFKAQQEKDEIIKRTLAENKELKVALKAREQVNTAVGGGGGGDVADVKVEYWTSQQLAQLKASYERMKAIGGNVGTFEEFANKAKENHLKLKGK